MMNRIVTRGNRIFALVGLIALFASGLALVSAFEPSRASANEGQEGAESSALAVGGFSPNLDADTGEVINSVVPGDRFYWTFQMTNNSDAPITVEYYGSRVQTTTNVDVAPGKPRDYCDQFFHREDALRQTDPAFPMVIPPGETIRVSDNATFTFGFEAPNECQRLTISRGVNVDIVPVDPLVEVEVVAPGWTEATCETPEASLFIPTVEGIDYLLDGQKITPGAHAVSLPANVMVQAQAQAGYRIVPDNAETSWNFTQDLLTCQSPIKGNNSNSSNELAESGLNPSFAPAALVAAVLTIVLGISLFVLSRRHRKTVADD